MKMTKYIRGCMLFAAFPLFLFPAQNVEKISLKTAVRFNTVCAKCHEGECSGRLSYDSENQMVRRHIRRYAGDKNLSKSDTEAFFSLLNHMKKECKLYMPDNGEGEPESLSRFALSSDKGYFFPLGLLKEGRYRIENKTKENIRFKIEVLSDHFYHFLDKWVYSEGENETIEFTIDRSANTFLRIQSKMPLEIITLKICRSLI